MSNLISAVFIGKYLTENDTAIINCKLPPLFYSLFGIFMTLYQLVKDFTQLGNTSHFLD